MSCGISGTSSLLNYCPEFDAIMVALARSKRKSESVGKRKSRILIRRNVRKQTARTQNEIKAREAYFSCDANCWINLQVYAPRGDNLSAGYVTLYLKAEPKRTKFFRIFFPNISNKKLFSSVLFRVKVCSLCFQEKSNALYNLHYNSIQRRKIYHLN